MEYTEYVAETQRAADLVQLEQYNQAYEILNRLLNTDISDIDKSMMCVNLAVVCDKQGKVNEALSWYDRGMTYEQPCSRVFVAMQKAGYLASRGLAAESRNLYLQLQALSFLTESDKETIRRNLNTLDASP